LRLRIKEVAEAQGLNRNQLQLKSGVTLPLLTRYWNNNTTEVKLEALEKIARALGVQPGDLIVFDNEAERRSLDIPDAA
jgi:DNA-binding Xre family transcriptional regulator